MDVVAGVNAACVPDRVLSPDLRSPPLFDFSSLERPNGGVAVDVRVGERAADLVVLGFRDGVAGRAGGALGRGCRALRGGLARIGWLWWAWRFVMWLLFWDVFALGRLGRRAARGDRRAGRSSWLP